MTFPYRPYETQATQWFPDGIVYRPVIPVRVLGATGDAVVLGLVDTGADETILPDFLGRQLGIDTDARKTATFRGIGGQKVAGVFGEVELELRAGRQVRRWGTTTSFVSGPTVVVLGRHGFLEHFRATFDERRRELILAPARARVA